MKQIFLFLFLIVIKQAANAQEGSYDSVVFQLPHSGVTDFAGGLEYWNGHYYLAETFADGGHYAYDLNGRLLKQLWFISKQGDTLRFAAMLPYANGYLLTDKHAVLHLFDSATHVICQKKIARLRYNGISYVLKDPIKPGYRMLYVVEAKLFLVPVFAYRKPKTADPLKNYHNEAGLYAIFDTNLSFRGIIGSLDSAYKSGALNVDFHAAISGKQIFIKPGYDRNIQVAEVDRPREAGQLRLKDSITLVNDHGFPEYRKGYDLQNYRVRKTLEMTVYDDVYVTSSGNLIIAKSEAVKDTTTFLPVKPVKKACAVNRQLDWQESLYFTKAGRVTVFNMNGEKLLSFPMRYNTGHILRVEPGEVFIHPVRLSPVTVYRYKAECIK